MKTNIITLHLWHYGDDKLPIFWQYPKEIEKDGAKIAVSEEIQAYFLYSEVTGDFNRKSFSKKRVKAGKKNSRNEFVDWICFRFYDPSQENINKMEMELKRGLTYFSTKDGFLFGAKCELAKIGSFIKISNPY